MKAECIIPRISYTARRLGPFTRYRDELTELPQYLNNNQIDILGLIGDFTSGLEHLYSLLMKRNPYDVDPEFTNIQKLKNCLATKDLYLIPPNRLKDRLSFNFAVNDLSRYMKNVEEGNQEEIDKGNWSRLHLDAIDSRHFVGTLVADLMAMTITRNTKFRFIEADLLCRAVLEAMVDDDYILEHNRRELLRIIYDQGWFTTEGDQFSQSLVEKADKLLK